MSNSYLYNLVSGLFRRVRQLSDTVVAALALKANAADANTFSYRVARLTDSAARTSATPVADDVLSFPSVAIGNYIVTIICNVSSTDGGVDKPGFVGLLAANGATFTTKRSRSFVTKDDGTSTMVELADASPLTATLLSGGATENNAEVKIYGVISVTVAGGIEWQWATEQAGGIDAETKQLSSSCITLLKI